MSVLETQRLLLRRFSTEDWRALHELILWYSTTPYAAYDHPWPASEDQVQEICGWFAASEGFRAVCRKEDGRFIGYVMLNPTEESGVLNLGYCFHGDAHGCGYARESCRAVIDDAFAGGALKIVTGTARDNAPSCRLLARLGFTLVRSEECAFQTDALGNRITFIGSIYELPRIEQE